MIKRLLAIIDKMPLWLTVALTIVFIFGLVPACVNIGVSYFPNHLSGDNNTWITFWGSYLGGIFTLAAVLITIKEQKKLTDKTIRLQKIQSEREIMLKIFEKAETIIDECVISAVNLPGNHFTIQNGLQGFIDIGNQIHDNILSLQGEKENSIAYLNILSPPMSEILSAYSGTFESITDNLNEYEPESIKFLASLFASLSPKYVHQSCIRISRSDNIIQAKSASQNLDRLVLFCNKIISIHESLLNPGQNANR